MVRIDWVDASSFGGPGWVDWDEANEFAVTNPPVMSTIGWILHEEPAPNGWITMTDTISDRGEECSSVHKIPYAMIIYKEYLQ